MGFRVFFLIIPSFPLAFSLLQKEGDSRNKTNAFVLIQKVSEVLKCLTKGEEGEIFQGCNVQGDLCCCKIDLGAFL